ncbi:MAG: hypothetical protein ABIO29_01535 [Sphingomicrobium sp.]
MSRALVVFGLIICAPLAIAGASSASAQAAQPQHCTETPAKKARKSMFGNILGGIADSALGRFGGAAGSIASSFSAGSMLSDAIINMLDCKEQQQAAKATDQAIRGGVGTEVTWTSESRPNVAGKSTVTAEQKLADGGQCMTVTDIVIVDGVETSVPKRMCRAKGAQGFARV